MTQPPSQAQPVDPAAVTATFPPQANGNGSQQMYDAAMVRQQLQTQKLQALSVDQKIELALQKSTEAEKVAYRTMRDVSTVNSKLDKVLAGLSQQRQAPPTYAYDEDDPESIMSNKTPR